MRRRMVVRVSGVAACTRPIDGKGGSSASSHGQSGTTRDVPRERAISRRTATAATARVQRRWPSSSCPAILGGSTTDPPSACSVASTTSRRSPASSSVAST